VEDDAGDEIGADRIESIAKPGKVLSVVGSRDRRRLDLDREDATVVRLDNGIDLETVAISKVM
jgi:hypothetical protein